jgi:hypothetical protein
MKIDNRHIVRMNLPKNKKNKYLVVTMRTNSTSINKNKIKDNLQTTLTIIKEFTVSRFKDKINSEQNLNLKKNNNKIMKESIYFIILIFSESNCTVIENKRKRFQYDLERNDNE